MHKMCFTLFACLFTATALIAEDDSSEIFNQNEMVQDSEVSNVENQVSDDVSQVTEDVAQSEPVDLASQRDTLWIVNDTHRDEGGSGRSLYLLWDGDVHYTYEQPRQTYSLDPGQKDYRDSTYIHNGYNTRNFDISVFRIKDGERLKVGAFRHGIYCGSSGETETVTIFKNYTADEVQLLCEYWVFSRAPNDDSAVKVTEFIGSIPRDQW
jgi:hypothetical protein